MNGKLVLGLLLLISATVVHCSDNPATTTALPDGATPTEVVRDISQTLVIKLNHAVLVEDEGLLIMFQDVVESRCPIGAYCFWEGQAIAEFLLIKPHVGLSIAKPIIRPGVGPDSDEFEKLADEALGYRLFLLELSPFPHIDHSTDRSDYTAKLRVETLSGY